MLLLLHLSCIYFRDLLAFVMIPVLQKQLDIFKDTLWNAHRIHAQKDTLLPDGVPNHIYNFPEEYSLQECGMCHIFNLG